MVWMFKLYKRVAALKCLAQPSQMAPKKVVIKKPAGKQAAKPAEQQDSTRKKPSAGKPRLFGMSFASIYPLYVQKVEKKGGKQKDVDQVICWLTGYSPQKLKEQIKSEKDVEAFFKQAPRMNPNAKKITGTVCGVVIEKIEDPLMRKVRFLDKLVDELAKGRPMEQVLRK